MSELAPPTLDAPADPTPPLSPGQLVNSWRWVLTLGWSLLLPALMVLGDAAHSLGKPTWWLDSDKTVAWWTPLPFLLPVGAALAGALNWRRWPLAAGLAVADLAATAIVDAGRVPTVAWCEGVLAVAGLCTSVACLAGRVQLPRN